MTLDPIKLTIKNTNKSVKKYIKTRMEKEIVLNHLESFTKFVKPNGSILDLGCGHGRDCKYFEEQGFSVTGIDLSRKMLKVAKHICEDTKFIHMDIRETPYKKWKFDGIWACASLYHLEKQDFIKLINDLPNILNENGILFIAIKEGEGTKIQYKEELGVSKFYSLYKIDEILKIIRNGGFHIIKFLYEVKSDKWMNIYAKYGRT